MNPTLGIMLARLRVSDLLRGTERQRARTSARDSSQEEAGAHYRLADGSWFHGRHDSA
jgi:hypothetical protein